MAVRIRLRRVGRKKQPSYRVVVADSHSPRSGAYIETVGFYDPRRRPAELRMDLEKVDGWLERGAEPSETVASLIRKARKGGDGSVALVTGAAAAAPAEPPEAAAPAEAEAEAAPAPEAEKASPVAEAEAEPAPSEAEPEAASEGPEPEAPAEA